MSFEQWLQSRLTAHGFPCGMIDGDIGPVTTAALSAMPGTLTGTEGPSQAAIGLDAPIGETTQLDLVYEDGKTLVIPTDAGVRGETVHVIDGTIDPLDCRAWYVAAFGPEPEPETDPEPEPEEAPPAP